MAGPTWMQHPRVVRLRQRSTFVDIALDVAAGFRQHRSSRSAAALTYYGFLSLFPLVVALTTVLGFLLEGNEGLQEWIVDSALAQIPLIGEQIAADPESLNGSIPVLIGGLAVALWSGMKAFVGLQSALDDVAGQSLDERANIAVSRGRALIGIGIIAVSQVGTAVLASIVAISEFPQVSKVLLTLSSLAVNVAALGAVLRWLRSRRPTWRRVLPGALIGGAAFTLLQLFGTAVVGRAIANASNVYGTFASVIGLLTWLNFHAVIALFAAELNQVLVDRAGRRAVTTTQDEAEAGPAHAPVDGSPTVADRDAPAVPAALRVEGSPGDDDADAAQLT